MKTSNTIFISIFLSTIILATFITGSINAQELEKAKSVRIITSFDGEMSDTLFSFDSFNDSVFNIFTDIGASGSIDSILGAYNIKMMIDSLGGKNTINISGGSGRIFTLSEDGDMVSMDLDLDELISSINVEGILEGLEGGMIQLDSVLKNIEKNIIIKTNDKEEVKEVQYNGDNTNITVKKKRNKIIIKTNK